MTGGLRIAGGAMSTFAHRHDVIANNLANVSTTGFARQDTFVTRSASVDREPFTPPEVLSRTDFRPGPPILTGNRLDLSLEGSGFFALAGEAGERYARSASLHVGEDGILQTSSGEPVLGENGVLAVGADDAEISVEKDGAVFVDGQLLDQLRIVTFASGDEVERGPGGLYSARPGRAPSPDLPRPLVRSGQLEGSSVSPVAELVEMIEAMRAYEAAASATHATNRTLERAVNDIARV